MCERVNFAKTLRNRFGLSKKEVAKSCRCSTRKYSSEEHYFPNMKLYFFIKLVEACGYRFESDLCYGGQKMGTLSWWRITQRDGNIKEIIEKK